MRRIAPGMAAPGSSAPCRPFRPSRRPALAPFLPRVGVPGSPSSSSTAACTCDEHYGREDSAAGQNACIIWCFLLLLPHCIGLLPALNGCAYFNIINSVSFAELSAKHMATMKCKSWPCFCPNFMMPYSTNNINMLKQRDSAPGLTMVTDS